VANSTETSQNSKTQALSATAIVLPDNEENRTAEVQRVRPPTPQSKPSGSPRSVQANRRKSRPTAELSEVKATLKIRTTVKFAPEKSVTKRASYCGKSAPVNRMARSCLGRASVTSSR
jgi:hypothetical protein